MPRPSLPRLAYRPWQGARCVPKRPGQHLLLRVALRGLLGTRGRPASEEPPRVVRAPEDDAEAADSFQRHAPGARSLSSGLGLFSWPTAAAPVAASLSASCK